MLYMFEKLFAVSTVETVCGVLVNGTSCEVLGVSLKEKQCRDESVGLSTEEAR